MVGAVETEACPRHQNPQAAVWALFVGVVIYLVARIARRPSFPDKAPRLLREGYPALGSLRFFSDRLGFVTSGSSASRTGSFSFYFGRHRIVGLAGHEARKSSFESRGLDLTKGQGGLGALPGAGVGQVPVAS